MEKVTNYILTPEAVSMVAGSSKGAQRKYALLEKEEKSRALEVLYIQLEKYKKRISNDTE